MVRHFIELIRPINCIMATIGVLVGAVIAGGFDVIYMTHLHIALFATFVTCGAGMAINDFCDMEIDFLNKRHRPIPSGRIEPKGAFMLSMVFFALGVYVTYFINTYCMLLTFLNSALLLLYAYRFKKVLVLGHIIVSYLVASSFLLGGLAISLENLTPLFIISLIAFFSNISREIIKTVEDMKEDSLGKVKSLPIIVGEKKARKIASSLTAISVALAPLPYLLGYMGEIYMYAIIPGLILFVFSIIWNQRRTPADRVHKLMKIAMMLCLLAFLVGAIY